MRISSMRDARVVGVGLILLLGIVASPSGAAAAAQGASALAARETITYVQSEGIGRIAVLIREPVLCRYDEGAPVIVNISGFFTASSGFDIEWNPDLVGAIYVTYLWPGTSDVRTGVSSEGLYDYGGADCLTALHDVIRFATGQTVDVNGRTLDQTIGTPPLYDIVGIYAFSHSGVAASNVLCLYGEDLEAVDFFVGRENPTIDALYPLEPGYWSDDGSAVVNPYYNPAGYSPTSIFIDYSTVYWSVEWGRPAFHVDGGPDYVCSYKHPTMWDKDYWSTDLLQALLENGALTRETWPRNLALPEEAAEHWAFRSTVAYYPLLPAILPELKVMLVFAADDHVQTAIDKPHIHQAYDGFHDVAELWCRLNPDRVYVEAFADHAVEHGIPDNPANREPATWITVRRWGYAENAELGFNADVIVPLAAVAEMCDRTYLGEWSANLDTALHDFCPPDAKEVQGMRVTLPDGTEITACALTARKAVNPSRDYGLYMDPAWAPTWDADLIEWPDFGVPAHPEIAAARITRAFQRARAGEAVEIGCVGGLGRTGTVLACMAVLAGVPAADAVAWTRAHYNRAAVETEDQEQWVSWFAAHRS